MSQPQILGKDYFGQQKRNVKQQVIEDIYKIKETKGQMRTRNQVFPVSLPSKSEQNCCQHT